MSRFNNLLKWIVFQINLFASILGWGITASALYLIFGKWGNLDINYFLGVGIVFALIGIIAVSFSCIGCLGVRIQEREIGNITGRKVLAAYQLLLVLTLFAELYVLSIALNYLREFNSQYTIVQQYGNTASLSYFEVKVAEKFNDFFYGASTACTDTSYQWFWNLINKNCDPTKLSQSLCDKCNDYSITACYADQDACEATGGISGPACPYTICRVEIIEYFKVHIQPIAYFVFGVTVFIIVMIILNCCLICYTKRDSVEEILYKAGIISSRTEDPLRRPLLTDERNDNQRTVNPSAVANNNREYEMMLNRAA